MYAQDEPASPINDNVIPPSTDAASLGEFGLTPPSYQVGAANISVPIYTIQGREVSVPIALSYDSKGIKVEDIAGSVGLGWSLNAGGVISRSVLGVADEDAKGYFNRYEAWLEVKDDEYGINPSPKPGEPEFYQDSEKYWFQYKLATGEWDLIPDSYSFNFGGYSGSITFKYDTAANQSLPIAPTAAANSNFPFTPIVSPQQDIKVIPPINMGGTTETTNTWKIITPNGVEYIFSDRERIFTTNGEWITSAWYLSEIKAPSGEKVTFEYNTRPAGFKSYTAQKYTTTVLNRLTDQEPCILPPVYSTTAGGYGDPDVYEVKQLRTISYRPDASTGSRNLGILFDYNESFRQDLPVDYLEIPNLWKIELDFGGSTRYFLLNYSNFGDDWGSTDNTGKRLQLKSAGFYEFENNVYNPVSLHKFEYNDTELPVLGSMSDHWGYANAGPNQVSFIPTLPPGAEDVYETGAATANREPDANKSLLGLISKVTYPTGGSTTYNFETHYNPRLVDNYVTEHYTSAKAYGDESLHGEMDLNESGISSLWDDGETELIGGLPRVRAFSFTLDRDQTVKITSSITGGNGLYAAPTTTRLYHSPIENIHEYAVAVSNNTVDQYLEAGVYTVVAAVGEELTDITAVLSVEYTSTQDDYYIVDQVGGARLKGTTTHDGVSAVNDITTEYFYYDNYIGYLESLEAYIPGELVEEPKPLGSMTLHYKPQYFFENICGALVASAYQSNPFGKTRGHHVGYSEVAEVKSGAENGITIYKFANNANPNFRSQKLAELKYDANRQLVYQEEHDFDGFEYAEYATGRKEKVESIRLVGCMPDSNGEKPICEYAYEYTDKLSETQYNYGTYWKPRRSSSMTTYDQNGDSITQTKDYTYHLDDYNLTNQVHYQLLASITEDLGSSGVKVTEYTYAPQVDNGVYLNMVNDHNYNHLVSKETRIMHEGGVNEIINGVQYTYGQIGSNYRPIEERMFIVNDGTYEHTRSFTYTPNGEHAKQVEAITGGAITTSYVYDDLDIHPIATFKGAFENEIAYTGFEGDYQTSHFAFTAGTVTNEFDGRVHDLSSNNDVTLMKTLVSGSYIIRLRAKNGEVKVNGGQTTNFGSKWSVGEFAYSSPGSLVISGSALIDELRVFPANREVSFQSLKIQDYVGVSLTNDDNLGTMRYLYDNLGRLVSVIDQDGNTVKEYVYNYKEDTGD